MGQCALIFLGYYDILVTKCQSYILLSCFTTEQMIFYHWYALYWGVYDILIFIF